MLLSIKNESIPCINCLSTSMLLYCRISQFTNWNGKFIWSFHRLHWMVLGDRTKANKYGTCAKREISVWANQQHRHWDQSHFFFFKYSMHRDLFTIVFTNLLPLIKVKWLAYTFVSIRASVIHSFVCVFGSLHQFVHILSEMFTLWRQFYKDGCELSFNSSYHVVLCIDRVVIVAFEFTANVLSLSLLYLIK